jgi:hypothetical protein
MGLILIPKSWLVSLMLQKDGVEEDVDVLNGTH